MAKKLTFAEKLMATTYGRLGPAYVVNTDEGRVIDECRRVASVYGHNVWRWSTSTGLILMVDADGKDVKPKDLVLNQTAFPQVAAPAALMARLTPDPLNPDNTDRGWRFGPSMVVALDFAPIVNALPNAVMIARQVRDFAEQQETAEAGAVAQLVMLGSEAPRMDCAIRHDLSLPSREDCADLLGEVFDWADPAVAAEAEPQTEAILNAVAGLPSHQVSQAMAESISRCQRIDPDLLRDYKRELVQAKGLTIIDGDERGFDAVGGMEPLKQWLSNRARAFTPEAAEYGIEPPKGIIVAGVPGCAKSALVKALVTELGFTGIRADLGATRGKYQGESEEQFSAILETAEAVAPCVLHLDEVEKAFAGSTGSGEADGGTASRTLSTFLTWLQEREKPVFVYMTANRADQLPPELTRAGRLDASWWVDVPGDGEREAIAGVFAAKYSKAASVDCAAIAAASQGNTGAEI
jgi:ATP-dependent 26S proteasome regulatory subunit